MKELRKTIKMEAMRAYWEALSACRCPMAGKPHLSEMAGRNFYLTDVAVAAILTSCRKTAKGLMSTKDVASAVDKAIECVGFVSSLPHNDVPIRNRCRDILVAAGFPGSQDLKKKMFVLP